MARKLFAFALSAIVALTLGVGVAELRLRYSTADQTSPLNAHSSTVAAQASVDTSQINFLETAKEMFAVLNLDKEEIVGQIRADCAFRNIQSRDVVSPCSRDQFSRFQKIKEIYLSDRSKESLAAVAYCMDENRSLNGIDWQDVTWCYERNVVALRRKN